MRKVDGSAIAEAWEGVLDLTRTLHELFRMSAFWERLSDGEKGLLLDWCATQAQQDLSSTRLDALSGPSRLMQLQAFCDALLSQLAASRATNQSEDRGRDFNKALVQALRLLHTGQLASNLSKRDVIIQHESSSVSPAREMRPYIITMIQTALVVKAIVLYFGLSGAIDPDSGLSWGAALAFALSLTSLFWFVYQRKPSD